MAKKSFFSIIIPALNEARYLPKLLYDLTVQSYRDFEVIVVDGGSKDKTIELAKTYSAQLPKLTIITSSRAHVCTQRNLGAKHANGEVLIFCDADNRLPSYFLQGAKYRWESSNADLLSFWIKPDISNPKNDALASAINTLLELQNSLKPTYLLESLFAISSDCFKTLGGFDESIDYAEGKSLIQKATKIGFKSKIVRDPSYQFSFRRFRKYGLLNVATRVAKMELAELLGPEFHSLQAKKLYPMLGGSLFTKSKRAKNNFLKNIQKILKKL